MPVRGFELSLLSSLLFLQNKIQYLSTVSFNFFGVPRLATCVFLISYNEPELGAEIDPGMALTPFPSSIGGGSNPQPSDREPSALLARFLNQEFTSLTT